MNLTELGKKLIVAAKAQVPNDCVPYAFEKRVMTKLSSAARVDVLAWWGRALWRGAAACVSVCLLLSIWSAVSFRQPQTADSFSEHLEHTILASANDSDNGW